MPIERFGDSDAVVLKSELSVTVTIDRTSVSPDSSGKRIVKAGTLVGHATRKLWEDRTAKASVINGATSQCITVNQIDVTDEDKAVSVLVRGTAYRDRMEQVQTFHADVNLGDRITLIASK